MPHDPCPAACASAMDHVSDRSAPEPRRCPDAPTAEPSQLLPTPFFSTFTPCIVVSAGSSTYGCSSRKLASAPPATTAARNESRAGKNMTLLAWRKDQQLWLLVFARLGSEEPAWTNSTAVADKATSSQCRAPQPNLRLWRLPVKMEFAHTHKLTASCNAHIGPTHTQHDNEIDMCDDCDISRVVPEGATRVCA
jgi:hypothetical protein